MGASFVVLQINIIIKIINKYICLFEMDCIDLQKQSFYSWKKNLDL